jgi:signal transduction histidine kinase
LDRGERFLEGRHARYGLYARWLRPEHGRRLQHQLFYWLAVTTLATLVAAGVALHWLGPNEGSWPERVRQVSAFASEQFAERWSDPSARRVFSEQIATAFAATLWLEDAQGQLLERVGPAACLGPSPELRVVRAGVELGRVRVCWNGSHHFARAVVVVLGSACIVLWAAAAVVARRLIRPLSLLIRTTREIGSGNLAARVRLGRHQQGELRLLAESVNDMARRIERQMRDQRELLAAVSHEVRSPLARLRVATEMLRSGTASPQLLDAVEREVIELDALIGKLLASSRLDFETLSKTEVVASELFAEVLGRRGLSRELLDDQSRGQRVPLDITLIARALDNLLDNAERHAGGARHCVLRPDAAASRLVFEVHDTGPGFPSDVLPRVFDGLTTGSVAQKRSSQGSLGLGLALVQRIARAHGGRAWVENLPPGGAKVAFEVGLGA